MRLTLNPIIWLQYLCWNVQFWMMTHQPYYPLRLRCWLMRRYGNERMGISWLMFNRWKSIGVPFDEKRLRPLPWYVGLHACGPFVSPWNRAAHFFRHLTGGRSHRCEFTDKKHGALYGGKDGPFMDKLFEQFVQNISGEDLD